MSKNRISQINRSFVLSVVMLVLSFTASSSALVASDRSAKNRPSVGKVTIGVDPRVELIAIVFRLAGNPEYNDGTLRPYVKAIERHFGDFDNDPVIKMAAELRYKHGMSCDGPMSLAVHIDRNYRLRKTVEEWPDTLDKRWNRQETEEFLEKLRQFASETKFDEFFKAQGPIYEQGIGSCESVVAQMNPGGWLGEFFGSDEIGDLKLVLGFVNGFANYGPRFEDGPANEKYAIVGMRPFDPTNTIIFLPQQIETVAHEFCHSFTNPIVDKYMDEMQPAGKKLFATHGLAMRMRGYQQWESVMYETAVRACVVNFIRHSCDDPEFLDYHLKREARHGFVWIEEMSNLLKSYESNRDKYPTFESFFPEFVKHLSSHTTQAKL